MKYLSKLFVNIAFFLHDDDADKAKRAVALVIIAFLLPFAIPGMIDMGSKGFKVIYGIVYAWRNNEPPSTIAKVPTRPPETYRSSSTAGEIAGPGPHRLAKAKHPHYGIIPLPVGTVAGHSTGGN